MAAKSKKPISPEVAVGVGAASGTSSARGVGQTITSPAEVGQPLQSGAVGTLISTTMPDELLRHNISDEELDVLCDPSRGELWELKWAAVGAFVSTLPSAAEGFYRYANSTTHVMGVSTLFQGLIVAVSLAVWLVLEYVVPQKKARSEAKRDEIRARARRIQEGANP